VWVANADGSHAHTITRPIDALEQVAWLPNGDLVYDANFVLWRLRPNGHVRRIGTVADMSFVAEPSGRYVATTEPSCPSCLGTALVTDLRTRRSFSTSRDGDDVQVAFSPDGSQLVIERRTCTGERVESCGPTSLWVERVGTQQPRLLSKSFSGYCLGWSPDGRTLSYVREASRSGVGPLSLQTMPASGGRAAVLYRAVGDVQTAGLSCPSWSPDSGRLAAIDRKGGVVVIDAHSGRQQSRSDSLVYVTGLAWTRDSKSVLVAGSDCRSLWQIDAATGDAKRLRGC